MKHPKKQNKSRNSNSNNNKITKNNSSINNSGVGKRQPKGRKGDKNNKAPIEKEFDTFRHEIYKFGLSGLDKKEQLDARVELAIKLGAKEKKWIKPNLNIADFKKQKSQPTTTTHHGETRETDKYIKINPSSST